MKKNWRAIYLQEYISPRTRRREWPFDRNEAMSWSFPWRCDIFCRHAAHHNLCASQGWSRRHYFIVESFTMPSAKILYIFFFITSVHYREHNRMPLNGTVNKRTCEDKSPYKRRHEISYSLLTFFHPHVYQRHQHLFCQESAIMKEQVFKGREMYLIKGIKMIPKMTLSEMNHWV